MRRRSTRIGVVAAAILALAAPGATALPGAPATPVQDRADRTSRVEAARVDRVPAPRLGWYPCYRTAECAEVELPLDYDDPAGPTTRVAVLRVKARDQKRRLGSLFINPGGPGGSGVEIALAAPDFLSATVRDRFDVVGFDPRGTNFSSSVQCFRSNAEQAAGLAGLVAVPFPYTRAEERSAIRSARTVGKGCSTAGAPLAASMSTAQVARDMDVLRRAVGDRRLTYLGFSYGSALGQYYANMFPDRVRALAIDGVVDPTAWVGTAATSKAPTFDRLRSADGATAALTEYLKRCDKGGTSACSFAAGDPVAKFQTLADRLKRTPLPPEDADDDVLTYQALISLLDRPLREAPLLDLIDPILTGLYEATDTTTATRRAAGLRTAHAAIARLGEGSRDSVRQPSVGFPYDNASEAYWSVLCTDSANPHDAGDWPAAGARADRRARWFGRPWAWASVPCARRTWTAQDEDTYRGPFTRRTALPVLVVGNRWDPATNYSGAVAAAKLLPNSQLVSSDSWGHTAYGSSDCVTSAVDRYLLTGKVPARDPRCRGDIQPFASEGATTLANRHRALPPVTPLAPPVSVP